MQPDDRFFTAPVLFRGKLHVEIFGDDFPGETPRGAAMLVDRVRHAVNVRFRGDDQPSVLFTDKGRGFYATRGSKITDVYKKALSDNSLQAYYGNDASEQPGNLQDVLLHETAVAWIRNREKVVRTARPWLETTEEFATRLRGICQYINEHYNVEGLCRSFPKRLQALVDAEGDRIPSHLLEE